MNGLIVNPLLESKNGSALVLTMNRPDVMNAMSLQLANELRESIIRAENDDSIRAIIITGAGNKAFCAGTDLKERRTLDADQRWIQSRSLFDLNMTIRNSSLPIIAAINGWCLGGGLELAIYCDLRIASDNSQFGWPEMTLGAYPSGGGAVMLPRIIGEAKAKEFFFTARRVNTTDALSLGLIHRVVSSDYLITSALQFVSSIELTSPLGLAGVKKSINTGIDLSFNEALKVDQDIRRPLESTEDYQEGVLAHFEKRSPIFKGK